MLQDKGNVRGMDVLDRTPPTMMNHNFISHKTLNIFSTDILALIKISNKSVQSTITITKQSKCEHNIRKQGHYKSVSSVCKLSNVIYPNVNVGVAHSIQ